MSTSVPTSSLKNFTYVVVDAAVSDCGIRFRCSKCSKLDLQSVAQSSFKNGVRPSLPFSLNYSYTCAECSPTGLHEFQEKPPSVLQLCVTTMANLTNAAMLHVANEKGVQSLSFYKDEDIIPFVERYWDRITSTPPKAGDGTWQELVGKTLTTHSSLFLSSVCEATGKIRYKLQIKDLEHLNPYDFPSIVAGLSHPAQPGEVKETKEPIRHNSPKIPKQKKKPTSQPYAPTKSDYFSTIRAFPTCMPPSSDLPSDPGQFRYILAECDRSSPLSGEYLTNPDLWHGHGPQTRPITGDMYRVFVNTKVELSSQEKAPQLILSPDGRTVMGDKGYSLIRAAQCVSHGRYYFEFKVLDMPGNSAVRAGWGTVNAILQAPLGYDQCGYSWRSRKGTVFHASSGRHYSSGYGVGDVLGCYIELPVWKMKDLLPDSFKNEPVVKFKNHIYYEVKDDAPKQTKHLKPLKGSKIIFFKNGLSNGVAFMDINAGHYFPSISLYKNATVKVNFGPIFEFPPADLHYLPMSDRVVDAAVEQSMADILHSVTTRPPGQLFSQNLMSS